MVDDESEEGYEFEDDEFEDDYEPTPQEEEHARQLAQMAGRYPTFLLLAKMVQRHRRLGRLRDLGAPQQIIDNELRLREEAIDAIADAFPYDPDNNVFTLPDVLHTLAGELQHPHAKGRSDA